MTIERSIRITNPTGLHARPAVKLAQLAASFNADVQLRVSGNDQWIKARSVAKVLKLKASADTTLHFRAAGEQATEAVAALVDFVKRDFDEDTATSTAESAEITAAAPAVKSQHGETIINAVCAAEGLAYGPLYLLPDFAAESHNKGSKDEEKIRLQQVLQQAVTQLDELTQSDSQLAIDIIGFQQEFIKDEEFIDSIRQDIGNGVTAYDAWGKHLDAEINDYLSHVDDYFRGRASDLRDLRDRVARLLSDNPQNTNSLAAPAGAILIAHQLTPSRFLEIDWSRYSGIVTRLGSQTEHVAMLARANQVPFLIQAQIDLNHLPQDGKAILLAEYNNARLIVNPTQPTLSRYQQQQQQHQQTQAARQHHLSQAGRTADGTEIKVYINVDDPKMLTKVDPQHCDGIGLARSEFLFPELPDEETQYQVYRRLLEWAQGRPVTIRTLDAGADKPIAGLTASAESNPFLGVRGVRLSLRNPGVFKVQLRALARAAVHGQLKVMLPMVTLPSELAQVRTMLQQIVAELQHDNIATKMPSLGMMVEVPAAALTIADFDADFFSIGSNDLIQYVMAAGRDNAELAGLQQAQHPAVIELVKRVTRHGADNNIEVSICGEIAAIPEQLPRLIESGITALSVAPTALALIKQKLSQIERS